MEIEPFKIKSVEIIKITTRAEREELLKKAEYNLFKIKAGDVMVDLLTDSGTSAMSNKQWSSLMLGDESYAGASSFFKFEESVKMITNHKHILPTHQGRGAERIVFSLLGGKGKVFVANTFFDTTRANIEFTGALAVDIPQKCIRDCNECASFKGNINTKALQAFIETVGSINIPMVVLTITNNTAGGQPVSMGNIKQVSKICKQADILFFLDACRFAENAYFIKTREKGYQDKSILEICNEMFSYVDGSTMSAKKDGLSNSGGWISLNNDKMAGECTNLLIMTEGFVTYGGLTGRELECIAQGLKEVMDERYLEHRITTVKRLGEKLKNLGVPIVEPTGGHAVYIDAKRFLPHIPSHQFPGQALACEIYLEGGIRTCEIGSVMFGKEIENGLTTTHTMELIRLAIPRRAITSNHLDYTANVVGRIYRNRYSLTGMAIIYQPLILRHFTSSFRMLSVGENLPISGITNRRNSTIYEEIIDAIKRNTKDQFSLKNI